MCNNYNGFYIEEREYMKIREGLSFNDVLLVPQHSKIVSRSHVDISTNLGKGVHLDVPVISANMKTVTGPNMAIKIAMLGGMAILHRFDTFSEQIQNYNRVIEALNLETILVNRVGISVGVTDHIFNENLISKTEAKVVCVDVAHGDHELALRATEKIANKFPNVLLIAGNVATGSGAYRLWNAGADVVKVGIGPGCFAAGTRVLMSNGFYKNIEEIVPGDKVINKNGKSVTVTNAFSTGVRKVVKMRNSIFYEDTYVTPDHKYFIGDLSSVSKKTVENQGYVKILEKESKTKPKKSKYKWQAIGENDKIALLMPKNIEFELNDSFSIEILKRDGGNGINNIINKVDYILTPSYDLGYIFGTFLGDGCASCTYYNNSNRGAITWYFGVNELDIANKLAESIKKIFNKDIVIEIKENIINCKFYYKPLADFLNTFSKKTQKHLPENLFINNKNYLQGILDGMIDSDGNIEKNGRVNFSNTSPQLIELFNTTTYLLTGVWPNNQKNKKSAGGLEMNYENISQPYVARINTTAEKRLTKDFQVSKMLEISNIEIEMPVYDITVDCETHSFIANNAIVHNSLCSTRTETGNGVPQLTALYDCYNQSYPSTSNRPKIIADGGVKVTGDVVKSLCFADAVMLGGMLAGTDETPGEIVSFNGKMYKKYAGSSTHKSNHIEGVAGFVPYKGPVNKIIQNITEGLRSGLSYQGCENLDELKENPEFIRISHAGLVESRPHAEIY